MKINAQTCDLIILIQYESYDQYRLPSKRILLSNVLHWHTKHHLYNWLQPIEMSNCVADLFYPICPEEVLLVSWTEIGNHMDPKFFPNRLCTWVASKWHWALSSWYYRTCKWHASPNKLYGCLVWIVHMIYGLDIEMAGNTCGVNAFVLCHVWISATFDNHKSFVCKPIRLESSSNLAEGKI